MWWCELPRAEAEWLAGEDGPLKRRGLPGTITRREGGVELDAAALASLQSPRVRDTAPGHAGYEGSQMVIRFGQDTYPVVPAQ